jgi:hypothetical protein
MNSDKTPDGFFYHQEYLGPSNIQYKMDLAKIPSSYQGSAPYWKMYEEISNYSGLMIRPS